MVVRKGIKMFKQIQQAVATVALVVVAVELETEGAGKGAEKKALAQAKIQQALDPALPDWLNGAVYSAAGMLIDALVGLANRTGFFAQFGAALSDSSPRP